MIETTGTTTVDIEADPQAVYDILTDLSRVGELSPECYRAEWVDGTTGPVVGARFHGYNRNGGREWDAGCIVLTADPGREWAFEVPAGDGRNTVWRYQIEPTDGGCRVTESFDAPILDGEFFQKINRHDLLVGNITTTLQNLKTLAES
ncbi:MAG: SRPBCC family protein [Actinomycetota bacterium]